MSETPPNLPDPSSSSAGHQARFDPSAPHQQKPRLRPIRAFPAQVQGQDGKPVTMLGLADRRQISSKMVLTMPAAQMLLPLLDGSRDIDQIVAEVGRGLTRPILEQLVAQLDDAALIEGPAYEALLKEMREQFDASDVLPPSGTADFADALVMQALGKDATDEQKAAEGPRRMREAFDKWIAQTLEKVEKPSFDDLPPGIVAPHLDYWRGWMNYASIYGRMRVCDRPERVIILGTNHFGLGTGVVGCNKGYRTPLGECALDTDVEQGLRQRLGDRLFEHRFDHEREHSIELQIPWIQHIFGSAEDGSCPKVFGALVHDPAVNNGESYDGEGIGLEPFVQALKEVIAGLPGPTLVVSSADLSHVGPSFGDSEPLGGDEGPGVEARNRVIQQDRELLNYVAQNQPRELVAAMAWQQNPTRWCSTGNLVATLLTVEPKQVELLNYGAAMDQQGTAMVSSAALVMW